MVQRGSVMRIQGMLVIAVAFGAADAQASSISIAAPLGGAISISNVGTSEDSSAAKSNWPSITVMPDTPAGLTTSIVTLGEPADSGEAATSNLPAHRRPAPVVFRGGEAGQASVRPPTASGGDTQAGTPLLDPNDRGTPAKRKALKRQAERLAREKASGIAQPEPSTEDAPIGN